MKQNEKVRIIKWYIKEKCCLDSIQTKAIEMSSIRDLEKLLMSYRSLSYTSNCCSCWHGDRDYAKKCTKCKDGSLYTFPYGYWSRFALSD